MPWAKLDGKIEYLHFDLGSINHTFATTGQTFPTMGTQSTVRNDVIRVGVNYKLGGG
ncbi:hypothetical protein [Bradyrhizobium liaoningense]|uniref:hypothetical protein n=1 Tax=Bradyrhizobium liaoningense TaxID=43992 RepID=UPI001BA82F83|nr:hypothetical protein [Bradyrhizobium liaoningense]MBR0716066.1 hypothetical protein [Bradyrhizobium liaoningense]